MRWSDGHPFTADDFVFWFQDMYQNKDLTPSPPPYMATKSGPGGMEQADASTIRFIFPDPYYAFPLVLAGVSPIGGQAHEGLNARGGYAPAHYLKQFHAKYVSAEELDRKVKEAKFDNWVNLFKARSAWALNPELPVASAWKTTVPNNTPTWVLERNPYSVWVDKTGKMEGDRHSGRC
jgi:peptide/nickel transport system substrate-binding protein